MLERFGWILDRPWPIPMGVIVLIGLYWWASDDGWRPLGVFYSHVDRVTAVVISADGRLAASASEDETVKLWTPLDQREIFSFPNAGTNVALCPHGEQLACWGASTEPTDAMRGKLTLWNVQSGNRLFTVKSAEELTVVRFSTDGNLLFGIGNPGIGSERRLVSYSWRAHDGKLIQRREVGQPRAWNLQAVKWFLKPHSTDLLRNMAISPDGTLAAIGENEDVLIVDLRTGRQLQRFKGHTEFVQAIVFDGDGDVLASSSRHEVETKWGEPTVFGTLGEYIDHGELIMRNVKDGSIILEMKHERQRSRGPYNSNSLAFSSDGRYLVVGGTASACVNLVNISDGSVEVAFGSQTPVTPQGVAAGYTFITNAVALHGACDLLTVCQDNDVHVWQFTSGKSTTGNAVANE